MTPHVGTRRVFIGIKMSAALADVCIQLQQGFADLPARFTRREDLHQTLVPPFEMADQGLVDSIIEPIVQLYYRAYRSAHQSICIAVKQIGIWASTSYAPACLD